MAEQKRFAGASWAGEHDGREGFGGLSHRGGGQADDGSHVTILKCWLRIVQITLAI